MEKEKKKCNGSHCRCMNIAGNCPNMHPVECEEHCPNLVKEWRAKQEKGFKSEEKKMNTCIVYRTQAQGLKSDIEKSNYNDSETPQFEACVFSDGRTAQRWLTPTGSMVWWNSWEDLCKVHIYQHPDYGTRIEWSNGIIENL